jgi:hypothetical protein
MFYDFRQIQSDTAIDIVKPKAGEPALLKKKRIATSYYLD